MQFPSMASLQGALPKTATHTPNYGASPYAPPMHAQTPSYAPAIPTSKQSCEFCKVLFQLHYDTIFTYFDLFLTI